MIEPLVEILLATYNGERFLAQQIDSILDQDYPSIRILARDDGSTDRTLKLLERYAAAHPARFHLIPPGEPSGGAKWNFIRLMQASQADYVCLADQDDFWLPTKITGSMAAMQALEHQHGSLGPLLVFTDLRVVDDTMQTIAESFWAHQNIDPGGILALRRLVTQNVLTGCTALMNRPLTSLATRMPAEAFMHDWWIALVACALGHATFLPAPTVLYRQHDANVVGAIEHREANLVPNFRGHTLRRLEWEQTERQAAAFLRIYSVELSPENRALLEAYSRCETSPHALTRVATQVRHRFFRTSLRHNLAILWYLWDMKAAKRESAQ